LIAHQAEIGCAALNAVLELARGVLQPFNICGGGGAALDECGVRGARFGGAAGKGVGGIAGAGKRPLCVSKRGFRGATIFVKPCNGFAGLGLPSVE
jgi:hypothetical protein